MSGPAHGQLAPAPPASPQTSSAAPQSTSPLALAPAPPPVRGRYLDAVPSVVRNTVNASGGRQVTLAVDITPKPSMRVYAPGNTGYSAVALTVDAAAGMTVGATKYPKAEDYLFAPLRERFKVYSGPFRLTREVVAGPASGAGRAAGAEGLTIAGRLEYQACDDKVCYLVQTLPLTWTVAP